VRKSATLKTPPLIKPDLLANIPLEFKTGQVIGNLSRVSDGASGGDDRGLAAVGNLLYGVLGLAQNLPECITQCWGQCPSLS
jgi:hypothetical protein